MYDPISQKLEEFKHAMLHHEKTYIGYPNNMAYDYSAVKDLCNVYVNNCGDPFSTLSWKKHSKFFEQEVINHYLDLYKLNRNEGWGYVTSGGTEGNMEGLLLARENFPNSILYYSEECHYSIGKIAKILHLETRVVKANAHGEMVVSDFEEKLDKSRPAIVLVNLGTTVKGGIDDLDKIVDVLNKNNVTKRYIHVDAALFGNFIPYLEGAPFHNFEKGIDSIAISAHKFLGCPLMSGIVIARKKYVSAVMQKIEYVNSHDTTISGSRNGHAPVFIWYILNKLGNEKLKSDSIRCIENAKYLKKCLEEKGHSPILNDYSNTVFFKKPSAEIVDKWQLATYGDIAHIIVMQHVEKNMIDEFMSELK